MKSLGTPKADGAFAFEDFEPTIVIASEADSQSESLRSRGPDVLMGHQLIKLPDPRPGNEGRADLSHADMVILAGD